MTRWLDPQPVDTSALENLGLHPLVAQTLIRHGYSSPDDARAFLDPLHSPSTPASELPGMDRALDRLTTAIRAGEAICVWGDFDVDGQTSTTILVQTLHSIGAKVTYHIPIRARENHGVNQENLKAVIDAGVKLILTCDTGISASEEVEYARSRGADFIITDHHDLPDRLPNAAAIVNPKFLSKDHPLANLPGAGVAYKLSEAILGSRDWSRDGDQAVSSLQPESLLDLVALGIIADLALLQKDTRAIAQKGIGVLRVTDRLGLKTIAQLAGLDLSQTTEETIGFSLGPRLNAIGRVGDANPAVELFLTRDPARARFLAAQIEGLNTQRRLLTNQVYQAAEAQLSSDPALLTQPLILLFHPSWSGGVIGIVASRLVERYHKPVLLLTDSDDGVLHGSARSVEGIHITQAIAANKKYLLGFGGHPMAAGLSLTQDNLTDFRKSLNKTIEKMMGGIKSEEPILQVDAWVELPSLSLDLVNEVEKMAPFGPGNPALLFATHGLTLRSRHEIGQAKEHLKLVVADDLKATREVMWWNGGSEEIPEALTNEGNRFELAYHIRANTYRGERQLSLEFVDFKITEQNPVKISKPKLETRDFRLQTTTAQLQPSTLIWAEGGEKKKGKSRYELHRADELAIWTTPPSPSELRTALDKVKPKTIYLFAVNPPMEKVDEFLSHLAGLAKFAIRQRSGKLNLGELAVTTAQREGTIKLGLEWLAASGHIVIQREEDDYTISSGDSMANSYLRTELFIAVKGLLDETAAYRIHFSRADPESIFDL
jgi:single-stranded-DNA-specific exonuclease